MKATELRIGNLVNYNNLQCKISVPDFAVFEMYERKKLELSSYQPIPLTEEWLLKFGFEEHPSRLFVFQKEWGEDEIEYINKSQYQGCYEFQLCGSRVKIIQYVHQLQNLYFALTGNELEIK